MFLNLMSENSENHLVVAQRAKEILEKFERGRILEVYFSRLDGRPVNVPSDHHELYQIDLNDMKNFLLGHHPQDTLIQKIFRMFI